MRIDNRWKGAMLRIASFLWIMLAVAGGWAIASDAADGPQQGPARTSPPSQTESIQAPQGADISSPDAATPATQGEIFYRSLSPTGAFDKGSVLTDMGLGLAVPASTPLERTKLEMARAAVEAARAAGTLYVSPSRDAHVDPSAEAAQAKLDLLHASPPAQLPPDPAAGAGVTVPPIQLVGPPQLTPAEIQKLADVGKTGGSR